jgi:hypothetical protein
METTNMTQSQITLGATYRDSVTGFEGIATNTTLYLFACERVWLSKGFSKEKGEEVGMVFDAASLVKIKDPSSDVQKALANIGSTPERREPVLTGGDRPAQSALR